MTKKEAVDYLVDEIERIEKERIAENISLEPTKQKKTTVNAILKVLKGIELDENQQD